jgi:hypothetical protein
MLKFNGLMKGYKNYKNNHWAWWYRTIIPALRRVRQKDHEFKASLGYLTSSKSVWAIYIARPCI